MLNGQNAIVLTGRGKSEARRRPYLFLIQALGAAKLEVAADVNKAKEVMQYDSYQWLFVDDKDIEKVKAELAKGKHADVKVAGNELVKQSLIFGELCEV